MQAGLLTLRAPSDMLPLANAQDLNLPTQWGPNIQMHEPTGDILIQTTRNLEDMETLN